MDTPGIHLAKKIDKMGMLCSDTAVIYFDDVRVPAKNIIGEEGKPFTSCGFYYTCHVRHGIHIPDDAIPRGKDGSCSPQSHPNG